MEQSITHLSRLVACHVSCHAGLQQKLSVHGRSESTSLIEEMVLYCSVVAEGESRCGAGEVVAQSRRWSEGSDMKQGRSNKAHGCSNLKRTPSSTPRRMGVDGAHGSPALHPWEWKCGKNGRWTSSVDDDWRAGGQSWRGAGAGQGKEEGTIGRTQKVLASSQLQVSFLPAVCTAPASLCQL
jgi:hypothetical protein